MATQKETADFILQKLRDPRRFTVRSMFGEFALYADGKVAGFICDDRLYIKIVPANHELEPICEKGPPYPGAKLYYIIDEGQLSTITNLPNIVAAVASSMPEKKKKAARKK
jgi:TfoX/Sxy family transcriptional regulator of competence genes